MTKIVVIIGAILLLQSCSNSSNEAKNSETDNTSFTQDPLVGEWIYVKPDSSSVVGSGMSLTFGPDKKIKLTISYYHHSTRQSSIQVFRKYEGLYRSDSVSVELVYTYTTCGDLVSEKYKVYFQDDALVILSDDKQKSFSLRKKSEGNYNPMFDLQYAEDTGCNKMFATVDKAKRAVASEGKKSLFDLMK